jgi:hypothetical protein
MFMPRCKICREGGDGKRVRVVVVEVKKREKEIRERQEFKSA